MYICEKKTKTIGTTSYTTKSSVFAKGKKTSLFFLKDLCQIYFVQKTKRTFLKTSCSKSQCWLFSLQKEKEKQDLSLQSFDLNGKTLLILFEAKFACCQKQNREHLPLEKKLRFFVLSFSELFVLPSFQNEGSKKQTNKVRSFFSVCQGNNTVVQDNGTFFCFQNQQAFGLKKKGNSFFLLEKLRSYVFAKKVWASEICNGK